MLEEGLLDGPTADRPASPARRDPHRDALPAGTVELRGRAQMLASSDLLLDHVRGRGGHASTPHLAVDPITVAAEMILALQTTVTRQVDAFDPAVLTIARVEAGRRTTSSRETVSSGHDPDRLAEDADRDRGRCRAVADRHRRRHDGATIDVEIVPGYPVTSNDPEVAAS